MRYAIVIALLLAGSQLWSPAPACAGSSPSYVGPLGQQSINQAREELRAAHRAAVRAAKRESEARARLTATVRYTGLYGASVGRWVRLARRTDWCWVDLPTLMRVVYYESRGYPLATNGQYLGLLQLSSYWYDDYWSFDPFVPRQNLTYGLRLRRLCGWGQWSTY